MASLSKTSLLLLSGCNHGKLGACKPIGEEPMAQVLCQINDLTPADLPLIPIRLIQVNGHKLVANLRSKLTVVHLTKGRGRRQSLILIYGLLEFLLIVVLPIVVFAFVLGPLSPPILIKTVAEHQDELDYLFVVAFVDHLGAVTEIENEDLIGIQHIALGF
jgi:hypothetical protein